jgi:PQQ-dependent dehydrogenase (s-GDH family)
MRIPLMVVLAAVAAAAGIAAQDVLRPAAGRERFDMRVVATGFDAPWEIAWGPDQQLWVTERRGKRVLRVNPADGSRSVTVTIPEVHQSVSQDGLLGLALHPDLLRGTGSDYVYVAFTYDDAPGTEVVRRTVIRRYTYNQNTRTLVAPLDLLTGLPAHDDHVAGRLAFGPDQKLYLSIGDQGSNFGQNRCNANRAQELPTAIDVRARNWSTYQGKILRTDLDGSIPSDNPEIEGVRSHVFSYGHRNPLGLAFGPNGRLYESEHGPSSDDEVNLIEAGRNYGWPNVAGYRDDKAYVYGNWSASSPQPCRSLSGDANLIPASVPRQTETAWNHPQFTPPLRTFFTVESGYDLRTIGSATIAPGGLDVYTADRGIPGWNNSLLALSLIRGTVFRLALSADGRATQGAPIENFKSANRYRDVALSPDQRTVYLITDVSGPFRNDAGSVSQTLANPGAILEFKYIPGPSSN